jgi:hypothetical protein
MTVAVVERVGTDRGRGEIRVASDMSEHRREFSRAGLLAATVAPMTSTIVPGLGAPVNPYRRALAAIAVLATGVGALLLILGWMTNATANQFPVYTGDPFAGFPELLWGAVFANLGLIAFLLWLAASAATWKPAAERD